MFTVKRQIVFLFIGRIFGLFVISITQYRITTPKYISENMPFAQHAEVRCSVFYEPFSFFMDF